MENVVVVLSDALFYPALRSSLGVWPCEPLDSLTVLVDADVFPYGVRTLEQYGFSVVGPIEHSDSSTNEVDPTHELFLVSGDGSADARGHREYWRYWTLSVLISLFNQASRGVPIQRAAVVKLARSFFNYSAVYVPMMSDSEAIAEGRKLRTVVSAVGSVLGGASAPNKYIDMEDTVECVVAVISQL